MSAQLYSAQQVSFLQIAYGSEEYREACELRNRVLRLPLGLDLYQEDLAAEASQSHFGLYDTAGRLLACVSVIWPSEQEARIRQMAVQPELQGLGYGSSLMQKLESHLTKRGVMRLELHARVTAIAFYTSLGFICVGERYVEVGIPHQSMVKHIRT